VLSEEKELDRELEAAPPAMLLELLTPMGYPPEPLFVAVPLPRPPPPEGEPPLAASLALEAELHAPTRKGPANKTQSQARILPALIERLSRARVGA
jgi:hypothetical protein